MAAMAIDVRRAQVGGVVGPFVRCANPGCPEQLARVIYTRAGIEFEVWAPLHDEDGVLVLERPSKRPTDISEFRVVRPTGARQPFRCARCGSITTVVLAALANGRAQR